MEFDYTTTTAKMFDEAVLGERPKKIDQIIQAIINNAK